VITIDQIGTYSSAEPPEVERLLNPAFCAFVLGRFVSGYAQAKRINEPKGCPLPLLFLCFPMAFDGSTRRAVVSHNYAFGLHRFLTEHMEALVGFPDRIEGYKDTTRTALLFGLTNKILSLDANGQLISGVDSLITRLRSLNLHEDATRPLRAADRLGHWFGQLAPAEVFIYFRVRP
jgi:ABC-3C biological conflict system middle component